MTTSSRIAPRASSDGRERPRTLSKAGIEGLTRGLAVARCWRRIAGRFRDYGRTILPPPIARKKSPREAKRMNGLPRFSSPIVDDGPP